VGSQTQIGFFEVGPSVPGPLSSAWAQDSTLKGGLRPHRGKYLRTREKPEMNSKPSDRSGKSKLASSFIRRWKKEGGGSPEKYGNRLSIRNMQGEAWDAPCRHARVRRANGKKGKEPCRHSGQPGFQDQKPPGFESRDSMRSRVRREQVEEGGG